MKNVPRIAIVDDDESVRRALGRLLRSMHYEPVQFARGEDLFNSLSVVEPECVILDLHLPGISGTELIERIRDKGRALPVIAMTGFDQTGTREKCLNSGAVDYLTKPIRSDHLAASIQRALDR